ncbi:MAG: sigma 54-interacting transcriptional regulator [Desulfomonile tiedjei]|nr:sigma 54-interacting transcriptional regulator [Desulfomonile tiedjei]
MKPDKPPSGGDFEDTESIAIDFATLLTEDVSTSGSFYVKGVQTSSLGKLLQALPIPALLIDQTHCIIFANEACGRMSPSYEKVLAAPITAICPDPATAKEIQLVTEEVFSTRKPRAYQAALGIENKRIWGRMFFRSLRMADQRLILILIEDLTLEKKQLLLSQKHQEALRKEIRERKRVEKEMRDSETLLRSILSTSPVGIGLSEDRVMEWANEAWVEMFGFENESEFVGQTTRMIYSSDAEYDRVGKILYESLRTGAVTDTDATFRRKDGSHFEGHIRMKALGTPDRPKATVAAISDISERKRAEQSLKESEERYRAVVQDQTELICRLSAEWKFTFVNSAFCRYFDVEEKELIGRSLLPLLPGKSRQEIQNHLASLSYQHPVSTYEIQVPTSRRERRWLKWTSRALFGDNGERLGFQFVGQDTTARKRVEEALRQSERRFRAIFEGSEDYIFLKDRSLTYIDVNPAAERFLGLPVSEIIGSTYEDLFSPEDASYLTDVDARVLNGETIQEEHTIRINDVPAVLLEMRVPLRDDSGEIIGIFTIARDITDRKRVGVPLESAGEYPSKAMQSTLFQAKIAAKRASTILLTGESGSGKDYLAQYIHSHSDRANGPFFSVNCAAIAPELAESELFGHEKGAFTGAVVRKRGLLELAEGGTLLLNEIGELSLALQSKLLSFLDTRTFTRVGGEKEVSVNARLIAATNRNLQQEVQQGHFRHDLFYRINVMSIEVPPLRERREDIPILVAELVARLCRELQLHKPVIDAPTLNVLAEYDWPGNVRELCNVLERGLILSDGKSLDLSFLKLKGRGQTWSADESLTTCLPSSSTLQEAIDEVAKKWCMEALRQAGGNKTTAARILRISRDTLYRYLKKLGIEDADGLAPED